MRTSRPCGSTWKPSASSTSATSALPAERCGGEGFGGQGVGRGSCTLPLQLCVARGGRQSCHLGARRAPGTAPRRPWNTSTSQPASLCVGCSREAAGAGGRGDAGWEGEAGAWGEAGIDKACIVAAGVAGTLQAATELLAGRRPRPPSGCWPLSSAMPLCRRRRHGYSSRPSFQPLAPAPAQPPPARPRLVRPWPPAPPTSRFPLRGALLRCL